MSGLPERVRARACCRVDLAGGTLDIWPLGLLHPGARTVNLAVDVVARVEIRRSANGYCVRQGETVVEAARVSGIREAPDAALIGHILGALEVPPVDLTVKTDSPRGGGLGGSSALAIALIAAAEAFTCRPASSPDQRSALARDLEARLMGLPTGRQDHFPALLGGALEILHAPGGEVVRRLEVDLDRLGDHLVVAYTGSSHFSAGNNWQVVRRRLEGHEPVSEAFSEIARTAEEMVAALEAADLERVGQLMTREWRARRSLADGVSTEEIETLLELAHSAGAWGGKACGAGGGGSIAVLCSPEVRSAVERALEGQGARLLAARPSGDPVSVEVSEPA